MYIVCLVGLVVPLILVVFFRNYRRSDIERLFGRHFYLCFYCCFLKLGELTCGNAARQEEDIRCLYPLENTREMTLKTQLRQGRLIFLLWVFICVAGLLLEATMTQEDRIRDGKWIARSEDDGTADTVTATAYGEDFTIEDIDIEVGGRLVTGEARARLFDDARDYLVETVRGNNPSLDAVREPLNLVPSVPETSIEVSWILDDAPYIYSDGSLNTEQISEQGAVQTLEAVLDYGGIEQQNMSIQLTVFPPLKSAEEVVRDEIQQQLTAENESGRENDIFTLPTEAAGEKIRWKEERDHTALQMFLLMGLTAFVVVVYNAGAGKREMKKRQQQLKNDYPGFIHKLVLLTGAGSTTRSALQTMVEDEQRSHGERQHYVYSEAAAALRMMQQGTSEVKAYAMFGKNCGDGLYIKLGTLLIQCVRKGAAGMNELLTGMADEALMMHRDQIRQKGETAGTKLLLPMGMLLIVVFMVLIVPAFMSINI